MKAVPEVAMGPSKWVQLLQSGKGIASAAQVSEPFIRSWFAVPPSPMRGRKRRVGCIHFSNGENREQKSEQQGWVGI